MLGNQQKVLIVKVGYSETLDPEISTITSYGDVLRTTVLLNLYKEEHVTWLVDEKSYPILKSNPYIDRVLIYNLTSVLQLESEEFDTVINLEKVPGLCALSDRVTAWRRYGFRFDSKTGEAEAYPGTEDALLVCQDPNHKRSHNRSWQEHLFEMVGATWKGEPYVFGYQPQGEVVYNVGFNFKVGDKIPSKSWEMESWKSLEALLAPDYSISWQEGLNDMESYFEWIQKSELLVTNDSFGLHLAIALGKKVVGLFGPTNPKEVAFYGCGYGLSPVTNCSKFPCYSATCDYEDGNCVDNIKPEEVYEKVVSLLESEEPLEISDFTEIKTSLMKV